MTNQPPESRSSTVLLSVRRASAASSRSVSGAGERRGGGTVGSVTPASTAQSAVAWCGLGVHTPPLATAFRSLLGSRAGHSGHVM